MDRDILRLELLKLTYKALPQLAAEEAIVKAKLLEAYCLEPVPEVEIPNVKEAKPVQSKQALKKKADNPFD